MDFIGMFTQLARQPEFAAKIAEKFATYCLAKQIPPGTVRTNHGVTWNEAALAGADALAEIIGEELERHPFLAKQAAKMMTGA